MDNKKNVLLAVILCVGILVGWQAMFPPPPPELTPDETAAADIKDPAKPTTTAEGAKPAAATAGGEPALAGETQPGEAAAEPVAPVGRGPERLITLRSQEAAYTFSTWGGTLRRAEMLGEKYTRPGSTEPVEIVRAEETEKTSFALSFPKSDFVLAADAAWEVLEEGDRKLVLRTETPEVRITKTFVLRDTRYRLGLVVQIENKVDRTLTHNLVFHLYARQDPEKAGSSFFTYATASLAEMVCHVSGDVTRTVLETLTDDPVDMEGMVRWIAADERFFTTAALPAAQEASEMRKCGQRAHGIGLGEVFLAFSARQVKAGETASHPFELYVGAKYRADLAALVAPAAGSDGVRAPEGATAELDHVVNVTFAFLSRPLLALLKLFFGISGNWGLAIIMLTLIVRILTFYPAHKQLLSGKKMMRLAPKLAELKKKYGDDRQKMGTETMNLYKAHGVNPLGGCLPALIQMPIWIALFSTLSYSVELYHSAFALHIQDLSIPDRFYAAPLIMGVVMYLQMRMSPAGTDPQQQKMMSVMMPIMFTGFSLFLPAGLAIYTLTSYTLGILHQLLVNHLDKKYNPPVVAAQVVASARTSDPAGGDGGDDSQLRKKKKKKKR